MLRNIRSKLIIKSKSALYRNNSAYVQPFKMVMPITIGHAMGLTDKDIHRVVEWNYNDKTKSLYLTITQERKEIKKKKVKPVESVA